jgi:hypothetical protein
MVVMFRRCAATLIFVCGRAQLPYRPLIEPFRLLNFHVCAARSARGDGNAVSVVGVDCFRRRYAPRSAHTNTRLGTVEVMSSSPALETVSLLDGTQAGVHTFM